MLHVAAGLTGPRVPIGRVLQTVRVSYYRVQGFNRKTLHESTGLAGPGIPANILRGSNRAWTSKQHTDNINDVNNDKHNDDNDYQ